MACSTRRLMRNLVVTLALVASEGGVGVVQPAVTESIATAIKEIRTETRATQRATARAERDASALREQLQTQEALWKQGEQDFQRLRTLVDTYGRRVMAQRLQVARTRVQRERERHHEAQVTMWEAQIHALAGTALDLDDKLYNFERQRAARLTSLQIQLSTSPATPPSVAEQDAPLARMEQAMAAQRSAWQAQAQVVAEQTRILTELITQHRKRRLGLNERYRFLLTQTFWMQDSPPVDGGLLRQGLAALPVAANRVRLLLQSEWSRLRSGVTDPSLLWLSALVAFGGLPWLVSRTRRYLRTVIEAAMAHDTAHDHFGAKTAAVVLMLLQTMLWPLYIGMIAWAWLWLLPALTGVSQPLALQQALVRALQWLAFLLWLDFLAQAITRRGGWGEHYLGLPREAGQAIRRTVSIGCLGALVLMLPRYVLLAAPGAPDMDVVEQSLLLARLCFLGFQAVLLILIGISCRRRSPAMGLILGASQSQNGGLWRTWPFIHGALVLCLAGVLVLDVQGFCYAACSIWLGTVWSLVTILGLLVVYSVLSALIQYLIRQQQQVEEEENIPDPKQPGRIAVLHQGQRFAGLLMILSGVFIIQHLYGIDTELLKVVNAVELIDISSDTAPSAWLTFGDLIKALLILAGMFLVTRNTPCMCEVCLFPYVPWDAGFRYAFLTLFRYGIVLFALWWSLTTLHLNWSSIHWIIAAASVGLGFGLQEILSNFVSGLTLLIERPISVGDIVTVGSESGTVTRITIRATFLQNRSNQIVILTSDRLI